MKLSGQAAVDVVGEAVVGQHCRNRREEADGRCHQGLGDAGATDDSVAWPTLDGPRNARCPDGTEQADMGDTDPTEARKARWDSRRSISR